MTVADKKLTLTLSKVLNLSEVKAYELLKEYNKGKVVYARENTEDTSVDPISLVIEIRSFYFRQRLSILNTIRLLLIHEGGHIPFYSDEINEFSKRLPPSLLNSLIQSLDWNSSDWRDFSISKQECHLDFSNRCTFLIKENHVICLARQKCLELS